MILELVQLDLILLIWILKHSDRGQGLDLSISFEMISWLNISFTNKLFSLHQWGSNISCQLIKMENMFRCWIFETKDLRRFLDRESGLYYHLNKCLSQLSRYLCVVSSLLSSSWLYLHFKIINFNFKSDKPDLVFRNLKR